MSHDNSTLLDLCILIILNDFLMSSTFHITLKYFLIPIQEKKIKLRFIRLKNKTGNEAKKEL